VMILERERSGGGGDVSQSMNLGVVGRAFRPLHERVSASIASAAPTRAGETPTLLCRPALSKGSMRKPSCSGNSLPGPLSRFSAAHRAVAAKNRPALFDSF